MKTQWVLQGRRIQRNCEQEWKRLREETVAKGKSWEKNGVGGWG